MRIVSHDGHFDHVEQACADRPFRYPEISGILAPKGSKTGFQTTGDYVVRHSKAVALAKTLPMRAVLLGRVVAGRNSRYRKAGELAAQPERVPGEPVNTVPGVKLARNRFIGRYLRADRLCINERCACNQ